MSAQVFFQEYGSPKVLQHGDESLPEPGEGEVRIANRAISVNPIDWKIVAGYLKEHAPVEFPAVPGNETAGVIEAIGPGVEGLAVGDEVIWHGFTGGFRQHANVPAAALTAKPAAIDFDQAAALPIAGGTAYALVHQIVADDGDTVLVHGAAGGVGSAAVQIAKARGSRVIGTASEPHRDYLRSIGAEPVAYGNGLVERVRTLGAITASVDAIGGEASVSATRALLPDLSRAVTAVPDEHSAAAGIAAVIKPDDAIASVAALAEHGILRFAIQERIPLAEAARAFELSYAGHVRGKLILVP